MTRDEIHKLPHEAQLYINKLERKLNLNGVVKSLNEDNYEHVLTFKDGKLISDKFIKIE
jgi:hypothetical protein